MKLLVNICSYDGISTHYCGVGTIVARYIDALLEYVNSNKIEYELNLYTTESYDFTLGYNKELENYHKKLHNTNLYKISNGSNARTSYGTLENWTELSNNTAKMINEIDISKYDKIITLIHDTPYCKLIKLIKKNDKHIVVWIPHSTVKIHGASSDEKKSNYDLKKRFELELETIKYINEHENYYLGASGYFIANHLIKVYGANPEKIVYIINGEILNHKTKYSEPSECAELLKKINNYDRIILSFGRAERYKNLEATMLLGKKLGIQPVVIVQSYYKGQPIIYEYEKLSKDTKTILYVDAPFSFPQYIINHFNKKIILLVPSKKEIMGLVINEIRKMNKNNVLIVANNIDGLKEQIDDENDGILIDLEDIQASALKIKKFFNKKDMVRINAMAQIRLKKDYDFTNNFCKFMNILIK